MTRQDTQVSEQEQAQVEERVKPVELIDPADYDEDVGNEPEGDEYPPDPEHIIHELERKQGKPLTPTHLIQTERAQRALQMRIAGVTYAEIARQLGWSNASSARKAVMRARARLGDESAPELKSLLYNRLNEALQRIYPRAMGGYRDPSTGEVVPPSLSHLQEMRAIMRDMAWLMGANTPEAANVHHHHEGSVGVEHSGAIVVSEWDEERFVAEMRRHTSEHLKEQAGVQHEVKPPSGYIAPQLQAGSADDDVIEAEVIEDTDEPFDARKAITL